MSCKLTLYQTIAKRGQVVDGYTRGIIEKNLLSRNPAVRIAALAAIKTAYGGPDPSCTDRLIRMLKVLPPPRLPCTLSSVPGRIRRPSMGRQRESRCRALVVFAGQRQWSSEVSDWLPCSADASGRAATDVIVQAVTCSQAAIAKAVLRRSLQRGGGDKKTLPVVVQLALDVLEEDGDAEDVSAASDGSHDIDDEK
eukprot:757628-Hanusia_phi.AAC.11